MRACVYLCVFVFLPVVDRGRCALNALGALCLSVLFCLNRSLPFSNRKLPLFLSQVTSYECTIFSFFPLHANKHLGYFKSNFYDFFYYLKIFVIFALSVFNNMGISYSCSVSFYK